MNDITTTNDTHSSTRATRREWIGLAVLALPCLLYSMDLTVLLLAIPQLSAELQPSAAQMLWIVDIYGFLLAGLLITMGTLGDRIGRRRLLMIGSAAFGVASVFAAFANSAAMLIAARALLGVAAATLAPSTLSLIRNMFHDPQERTIAIGVWIASFSAGGALGPVIGGVLLSYFWWGSVFLLAVPVMLLLLVIGPVLLPESRDPDAGQLDLPSAALSLTAVLAVIYGMKRIAEHGPGWLPALIIVMGIVIGIVFARRQLRLADPLIDLRLFRTPGFGACLAINLLTSVVAFGSFLFIAQYLQLVLGMTPLVAGLWTAPSGIVFVVGSMLTPLLVRRIRRADVMTACFALAAMAYGVMTQAGGHGIWVLLGSYFLFCLALAPVVTLATDLIVGVAPPERAGAAAAMSETSFEFGGALGIAALGSVVTAVYRLRMGDAALHDVPAAALETARDTLGGATAVARHLPAELGVTLLEVARTAFTQAFTVVAGICAAVMILAAIASVVLLRRTSAGGGTAPQPESAT